MAKQNRGTNLDLPQIGLHARPQAFKSQSSEAKRDTQEWVFLPQLNGEAVFVGSVCMNDGSEWMSEWFWVILGSDTQWFLVSKRDRMGVTFQLFLTLKVKGEWVSDFVCFWVIFGSDTEWFLVSKLDESDWIVFGKETILIWMGVTFDLFPMLE